MKDYIEFINDLPENTDEERKNKIIAVNILDQYVELNK